MKGNKIVYMARPPDKTQLILQELIRRANHDSRRLRAIEQRIQALESKTNNLEEMNLNRTKKINTKFAEVTTQLNTISEDMVKLKNNIDKINKQVMNFARKTDIKELEKMFDLLNPLTGEFVTRDELEKALKRV
jgi:chromosome segregation ATPase